MPSGNHKLAEPVEAGEDATSDVLTRPASKTDMDGESEPMVEASVDDESLPTRKWAGRPNGRWRAGLLYVYGDQGRE